MAHKADRPIAGMNEKTADEVAYTTCYMCACRCGIKVHKNGDEIRYIEGNPDHPINKGVLCAKGSAGIMQHLSPARLEAPMKRVGPRGRGEFEKISWEEAFEIAEGWLKPIRETDPKKLAFFTGRDQSQALTGWWAQQFGTPNFAAHGGFCSVNMATAGIYTMGGAFWEFGQPDWDNTKLFLIFGVAEDHDSNPIKMGLTKMRNNGGRVISINPVRTGYSAIADEWVGINPGTDGLFVLSLVHELLKARKIDTDYLMRYSNAAWLLEDETGMFARDDDGNPLVSDGTSAVISCDAPKLHGEVKLANGKTARPSFELLVNTYLDDQYAPNNVAEITGVSADTIRSIAAELGRVAFEESIFIEQPWTDMNGVEHKGFHGRPVAMHGMRGISAHSNGFQTCRAIHMLQILLGTIDVPGGFRFKPPYPKPSAIHPKPAGKPGEVNAGKPLAGAPLGFVHGPEDLLIDDEGNPQRIDKAYSWDAPMSAHGMMHMVISNAHAGDPYKIDTLFMYMANMSWNSSMNSRKVMDMLEDKDPETGEYVIPHIIYSDAYNSEMVAYADLIFPDTTYLERHDCISLLDRPISEADAVADAMRHPVFDPGRDGVRDVRGFQSALIQLGGRLGLPGMTNEDGSAKYKDYADYIINHERKPGIGPLAGFRGEDGNSHGRGAVNKDQINRYIENGGFWMEHLPDNARYMKFANKHYQDFAVEKGFYDAPQPITFQLYLEPLQKFMRAAEGHGDKTPPPHIAERMKKTFTPLPTWYAPFEQQHVDEGEYPIHAITQRPAAMYHSWGSQNAWLRQIHSQNPLFIPEKLAKEQGLEDGDWAWVISANDRIKVQVKVQLGVNNATVWTWNAIGKRSGAWGLSPDAPEAKKGFLLNHLINELLPEQANGMRWANSDPITGQAAWYDLKVRVEKAEAGDEVTLPQFATQNHHNDETRVDELTYGDVFTAKSQEPAE